MNENQITTSHAAIRDIFIESAEVNFDLMKLLMSNTASQDLIVQTLLDNASNLNDDSLDDADENADENLNDSDDDYTFQEDGHSDECTPVTLVNSENTVSTVLSSMGSLFKQVTLPTGIYVYVYI